MPKALLVSALLYAGCCAAADATSPRWITPVADQDRAVWTSEERARPVAARALGTSESASHHWILLSGAEEPHVHDRTDLTTFVLRGTVRMHFADRTVVVGPGDVIDIPRGTFHWAENIDSQPSEAYVIFAPPFDGSDRRSVAAPTSQP